MSRDPAKPSLVRRVVVPMLLAAAGLVGGATSSGAATTCADLKTLRIAASEITAPTSGASISSSQLASVPANPGTPGATREYCKVLGAIAPVNPSAPPI